MKRIEISDRDLAVRIFSWLFRALRILTMEELLEALVVEEGDGDLERECLLEPMDVITCCNGLVLYEEASGIVRFSHKTVHDYISNDVAVLPEKTHLANNCLTYLAFNVFDQPCSEGSSLEARVQKYRFSLYAAQFWGLHAKESEECREVQESVIACFGSKNRRNAILQIEAYARSNGRNNSWLEGQTLLHLLADAGLATICGFALEQKWEMEDPS